MNASAIAAALDARRAGRCWMARCPAHDDRDPSLSIKEVEGKVLVKCHAGCDQRDVIAALKAKRLWKGSSAGGTHPWRSHPAPASHGPAWVSERVAAALSIWEASRPYAGSLVETYLARRGLSLASSASLRFHPGLKHPSGGRWPAMVALVQDSSEAQPLGVHRTFLARDGSGKAPVSPRKMMLGLCRGGAVRLAETGETLMVGEGIETCLAAMQATQLPVWAALSTAGLRALGLPDGVREVIILADGDDPGEAAACASAMRWKGQGRRVRIARPPAGTDFNDLLLFGASKHGGGRHDH